MTTLKIVENPQGSISLDELIKLDQEKKNKTAEEKKSNPHHQTLLESLRGMEGNLIPKKQKKRNKKEDGNTSTLGSVFASVTKGNLAINPNKEKRENNRFYLPVLNINKDDMWESQPLDNRLHFTDKVAYNTCIGNCCGVKGLKAGCCYLDPEDIEHVLGPVDEEWIKDFVKHLRQKGFAASRHDVVIDFEEGKLIGENFFAKSKNRAVFQSPDSYPILRIQAVGPRFACKYLNFESGKCTIYDHRPNMCRNYLCKFVLKNFLVRTKQHPNTYIKVE